MVIDHAECGWYCPPRIRGGPCPAYGVTGPRQQEQRDTYDVIVGRNRTLLRDLARQHDCYGNRCLI
jgi:hypothetical protein